MTSSSAGSDPDFVVPPVRHDAEIRLVDPDPQWAEQFTRQRERIAAALGPRARQVEHVGSTSVPGLAAKPVIDIDLAVANSVDEDDYVPQLEAAGFVLRHREPDWYQHRFLRDDESQVQIHVFSVGCPEIERMLRFRDRLRHHPEDRELYERTKRELAGRRWQFVQDYADAKSDVIGAILSRAPRP